MNDYNNYLNDTANRPKPPGFESFAEQFKQLGKRNHVNIRLVWMPDQTRFLWGATRRLYAFKRESQHVGWEVGRMESFRGALRFVPRSVHPLTAFRYDVIGAHRLPNGDWVKPKFDYTEVAHPRWAIEEMLNASREKPEHDKHRYEYFSDTNELVDALGEYPLEGKWACIHVIAAHGYVCCKRATEEGRFCYGTGRDPAALDLEEVEARIQARDGRKRVRDNYDFEVERARLVRERMASLQAGEDRQRSKYTAIFGEEVDPWFAMQVRERQKVAPVNRIAAGTKRLRLYDNYGKELPVKESYGNSSSASEPTGAK